MTWSGTAAECNTLVFAGEPIEADRWELLHDAAEMEYAEAHGAYFRAKAEARDDGWSKRGVTRNRAVAGHRGRLNRAYLWLRELEARHPQEGGL